MDQSRVVCDDVSPFRGSFLVFYSRSQFGISVQSARLRKVFSSRQSMSMSVQNIQNEAVEYIAALATKIRDIYRLKAGFSIRCLYETGETECTNILTLLKFMQSQSGQEERKSVVPGTGIEVYRGWLSLEEGIRIARELAAKLSIDIDSKLVRLPVVENQDYIWFPVNDVARRDGLRVAGLDRPASHIFFTNRSGFPMVDTRKLRSRGYNDILDVVKFEVLSEGGVVPPGFHGFGNQGVVVMVPHWHGWLSRIEIVDSEVRVTAESDFPSPHWENFRILCKVQAAGYSEYPPKSYGIGESGILLVKDFEHGIDGFEATLYFEPEKSGASFWVDSGYGERKYEGFNPLLAAHEFADPGFRTLELKLLGPEDSAEDFEWATLTLLHLAGFLVEWSGYIGMKGRSEIDVVAIDRDRKKVLAIECTLADGALQKKFESLQMRTVSLEKKFPKWEIVPLVFITRDKEQLRRSSIGAVAGEIGVLTRDDLRDLLALVRTGAPLEEVSRRLFKGSFRPSN